MSPPPKRTPGAERGPAPPARRQEEIETSEEVRGERPARGRVSSEERAAAEEIPSEEGTMATKKALVVGINDYGGPPNDLPSCVNDANAITQLLQSRFGFKEVHTVRDGDATSARVEEELKWLSKSARPDDRLVFYFSGHGYTKLVDGVMQEFLVLRDGLFDDNQLVSKSQDIAPGTLTVILDASFSGGVEKVVFDPTGTTPDVELAQVKSWKPRPDEAARDKGFAQAGHQNVTELRRFGCSPIASRNAIAKTLAAAAFTSRATQSAPSGALGTAWLTSARTATEEAGQLELNGLLVTSCLETETAAASTSKTDGLSAFTHALVRSVEQLGTSAATADVLSAVENHLKKLGVRQTPQLLERATPGNLARRSFIGLEPAAGADNLGFLSEPRFWEGVLTAMTPQIHALRAVYAKEGELMSTMYQPTLPGYQGSIGNYQPSFGMGQPGFGMNQVSPEDIQRIIPHLGPVLATVIPAVVPPIVQSILSQQRGLTSGTPFFGGAQQTSVEDVQRLVPVLGPVLASVIPAILPSIINNLIAQQKAMSPGLGQQTAFGQYAGPTASGWGGGAPTGDITQTVQQSIAEALRRVGIQTPALGQSQLFGQTAAFGQSPTLGQSPVFGGRF